MLSLKKCKLSQGGKKMSPLEMILTIVYIVVAVAIIAIVLLQEGKSAGLGSAFATSQDSYYNKNKGRTLEGKFEKWTKIAAAAFVVLALILMIV
jgi:preprotein translocase subunit SecG